MESFVLISFYIIFISIVFPIKKFRQLGSRFTNNEKIYLFLTVFFMLFLASFRRYDIGNDTEAYHRFFSHMVAGNYSYDGRVEIGFRCLNILISKFTDNYTVFLLIVYTFLFSSLILFIKREVSNLKMFVCIFWLFGFITFVSPIRQTIALAIVLLSIKFIKDNRFFIFYFSCFVAATFHATAFVAIVFPFLYLLKPKKSKTYLILLATLIAVGTNAFSFIATKFLGEYYSRYLNVQSGITAVIFNVSFSLVPILIEDKFIDNSQFRNLEAYRLMKFGTLIYACFYIVSLYTSGAGRLAYFFCPLVIVYWGYVINALKFKLRISVNFVIITVLFVYRIFVLFYRPEWNSFFPFHFIWTP